MIFLKIEIKNKKENILLSRIELEACASFDKKQTPSTEEIKQELSKVLEIEKGLIVVKKIHTSFGDASAKVFAYQYLSKEELKKIERSVEKKEEPKKAEAKAEAPKEEVKKEEPAKKEEPKEEDPKEEPKKAEENKEKTEQKEKPKE